MLYPKRLQIIGNSVVNDCATAATFLDGHEAREFENSQGLTNRLPTDIKLLGEFDFWQEFVAGLKNAVKD